MVDTTSFDKLDGRSSSEAGLASGPTAVTDDSPDLHSSGSVNSASMDGLVSLSAASSQICIDATIGQRPVIFYAGARIEGASVDELKLLGTRQHARGGADVHLPGSILNELATGVSGPSGFIAHRDGKAWAADFRVVRFERPDEHTLTLECEDANTRIAALHLISVDPDTGVCEARTTITNLDDETLQLQWCAALCLPMDERLEQVWGFTGRWGSEFQIEKIDAFRGGYLRENKSGRTSHDAFPGLVAASRDATEDSGIAAAFHLGWSGNNRVLVDRGQDGQSTLQMGELLFPGEIMLGKGESYATPPFYSCWSSEGVGGVSRQMHRFVADQILDGRIKGKSRPVHYNTWEAIYFDHDEAEIIELAESAAAVGAERFVLDDGWFGGRRNDKAGLGDWWVSQDVYPNGLHAIANRVRGLGMEFGLWFEPEMVNPDSDLYRAHPDWVLDAAGVEAIPFRNQLPLDLTKQEVFDYLFDKLTALVDEYQIAYIKWDMNRDINHPGSGDRGAMHRQTLSVYGLIQKLREAHPGLEIESCSSGGARVDFGILRHTDRFWTSDNNDARQRHAIQRGASHFFPLAITGTHVGPKRCHSTGRVLPMAFRAGTAIFGHMGMELDLRDESEEDRATLAAAIALHKRHRDLIHSGDYYRGETEDFINLVGCVAANKNEALFSCALLDAAPTTMSQRMRLTGLDPNKSYRLKLVWPTENPSFTSPSIIEAADLLGEGIVASGAALAEFGVQMPLVFPDTCLIFHLEAEPA